LDFFTSFASFEEIESKSGEGRVARLHFGLQESLDMVVS
jgi:hypothetical protein